MIFPSRLKHIESVVKELHQTYGIAEYPILTHKFIKSHFAEKIIIKTFPYNDNADIVTNYYPEYDKAIMLVNRRRITDRLHKRLNFSFAHELGHLVLNHMKYYKNLPESELQFCEEEADEFAGRFLVPDQELYDNLFPLERTYYKRLSNYFHVSEQVIKIRTEKVYWEPLEARRVQAFAKPEIDLDRFIEYR